MANVHLRGNLLSYIYLLARFRREYYFNDGKFCEFWFFDSLKKRDYHVFARDPPPNSQSFVKSVGDSIVYITLKPHTIGFRIRCSGSVVLFSKNLFSNSYSYLNNNVSQDFSFSYSM